MMMLESIDRWMTAMVSDEGSGGEGLTCLWRLLSSLRKEV